VHPNLIFSSLSVILSERTLSLKLKVYPHLKTSQNESESRFLPISMLLCCENLIGVHSFSLSRSPLLSIQTHTLSLSLSQFLSPFSFFLHLPLSPPPSLFFPPDSKDSIDSIAFNISAANFLMRPFFLFLFLYLSSYSCRNCKAALISLVTRRRRCIMHECTKSSKSKATYKKVWLHWHLEFLVFVCVFHVKRELGRKAIVVDLFETDVY
jgi:hypothetical protein